MSTNLQRANLAAGQLLRNQLDSALFPYDFDFGNGQQTDMEEISGVNLVRQASAIFALAVYLERSDSTDTRQTIVRFLHTAAEQSIPIGKGYLQQFLEASGLYNRWQLWRPLRQPLYRSGLLFSEKGSGKLVSAQQDYERAFPGATALTMIAALKYRTATGDQRFDSDIVSWKNGLLALMVKGRGLREAPHYLSESPYVNGEAWLALAEYQASFPADADLRPVLAKFEDYLLLRYRERPEPQFYSWGVMALNARLTTTGDPRYSDFAITLSEWLLSEEQRAASKGFNSCATIEGVATFVHLMKQRPTVAETLVQSATDYIAREMAFNRTLQIDHGLMHSLAALQHYQTEANHFRGAFILSRERPLMQVDLTAHCLNALLLTEL